MNSYVKALLDERRGYVARGLNDRVKQIDDALRDIGFDHKYLSDVETTSVSIDVETTTRKKPTKRKKG